MIKRSRRKVFKLKSPTLSEHTVQTHIARIIKSYGAILLETDVMSGLQFVLSKDSNGRWNYHDPRKYSFINHHKNMGYTEGQSDLVMVYKKTIYFIEVKAINGEQSREQKEFQAKIESQGFTYLIWRRVEDALDFFKLKLREG